MLLVDCCWLLLSLLLGVGCSFAWLIVVGCCYRCWVLAVLWLRIVLVDCWCLLVVVVVFAAVVMFVASCFLLLASCCFLLLVACCFLFIASCCLLFLASCLLLLVARFCVLLLVVG